MSVPSAPIIYYRPMAPSNRVELYWQPPSSTGGSPITSYILESANISYIEILPSTATKAIVGNLINGTSYVFTIKATNINGNGNVAVYDPFQPGEKKPLIPANLQFTSNIESYSKLYFTFNDTTDTGNSKILYNVVTMTPIDVNGNILETSSLKYYASGKESNIVNPVVIERMNTNFDYLSQVRARNSVNFSDRGISQFIINPNLPTNGLKLWLDPYDLTTITLSNSRVTRWVDKSRNRSNAIVIENFAPTYDSANSLINFNGSQYLTLSANTLPSGNTSYSIFTYVSTSNISRAGQWLLYSGTPSSNLSLGSVINGNLISHSWFGSQNTSNSNINLTISYLLEMTYNNGIRRTLINGNLVAQDSVISRNSTTGNNIIGSNSTINGNLVGSIGDVIIYDRLLDDIERNSVKNYLERKKLTLSLQNMGNLIAWFDASDNNTLYNSNINAKVSYHNHLYSWLDKTGNGNYARQSNISVLPIRRPYNQNNLDTLEFNQSYLTLPLSNYPLDAYIVVKLNSLSETYGILGIGPNSNNYSSLSYNTSGGNLWSINATSNTIITSAAETSGNFLLMELGLGNSNNYIRRYGANISNVTTGVWSLPPNSNIIIGNNNGFNFSRSFKGFMGEIILFNRQLNDGDRQQIEGYLAWKWGLQSFLASNHPFKNSAPYLFIRSVPSNVFTTSLILWVDSRNPLSYPGTGSIWFNLVPQYNNINMTLYNSPTLSTVSYNGTSVSAFNMNGSNQYISNDTNLQSYLTANSNRETREIWFYWNGNNGVLMTETGDPFPNSGWHDAHISIINNTVIYSYWSYPQFTLGSITANRWHHIVYTFDNTTSRIKGFLNGVKTIDTIGVGRQYNGSNYYLLLAAATGTNVGTGNYFGGSIAVYRWYNTIISDNDIINNFNSERGGFGV
jgi:hypothetical protein